MKLVGCGQAKWIKPYHDETRFPGECYSDPDRNIFQALQLYVAKSLSELTKGSSDYTGSAFKGAFYSGKIMLRAGSESGDPYQQGAVFVLGPGGQCHYHYFEKAPSDHSPIEDVFRAAGAVIPTDQDEKVKWANPDADE